jgi:xanthine dehydrogenase YagR molybdenum-binding subunit
VRIAASDLGTGTWTVLAQVAADTLGLAPHQVEVEIGDTDLPPGSGSGGSRAAASCGSAVFKACESVRAQLVKLARKDERSPVFHAPEEAVAIRDGVVTNTDDPARSEPLQALLARHADALPLTAEGKMSPSLLGTLRYNMHAFGAQFAEVGVDVDTGTIRLRRMLGVFAAGRILNAKTARSQLLGGMIMGVGMALMEQSWVDGRFGHFANHDLAEYHVPIAADLGVIEAITIPEEDDKVNPLGVKGVGEIGIVGAAAAIANAVYHATGVRVRSAPVTLDKVLAPRPHPAPPPTPRSGMHLPGRGDAEPEG